MLTKSLQDITYEDFDNLCNSRAPENRFLEFKRDLPGPKDKDRFEFVKDVSAFANADGGDLIYGIEEQDGCASAMAAIKDASPDSIELRLRQILDAALEPRLDQLQIQCVPVSDGHVVIVRIPSNAKGPFRVIQNSNSRFVIRDVNYVRDMTFSEIRSAFSADREFRSFVDNQQRAAVQKISEGATWRPLLEGPALAFQIIPFACTTGRIDFDVIRAFDDNHYMNMSSWGDVSKSINLDGVIFHMGSEDKIYAYSQAQRNGIFELFTFSGHSLSDAKIIPALSLAKDVREAAAVFSQHYRRLKIGGPAALALSLVGTKGRKLEMGNRYYRSNAIGDRDVMTIPPVYLENIGDELVIDPTLKSLMDITWQAFGIQTCPYYDENGDWLNPN